MLESGLSIKHFEVTEQQSEVLENVGAKIRAISQTLSFANSESTEPDCIPPASKQKFIDF